MKADSLSRDLPIWVFSVLPAVILNIAAILLSAISFALIYGVLFIRRYIFP